ncbi:inorganic pyrophosphatase [Methanosarcina thermophila]|jgi:inorganic pyrophosphatase|uniref:Inorganic pyrophosphatase n=3 Tax=Methanosarcina thermophila TaxID=2210 RepID=A0A1I6YN71_METTE|nr:inorganic diphosphatase [Methanosarcina thermophila]AKB13943.1 Inorganic pyrophosphatase [Methanosarcina thermophila TM-1]AKB15413.1 Inorganic pyrophosphatase [Methanosarcina thermophila CHTI-55]NLU56006.1 inorganic diphosphatase [Methanosarcina thermophila]SFT51979.1 inorganic pyrophosphatase [Methanosarcina thermophila]BAW28987.1 inorganic pyrophosphatase [Methanosarcina thermophila]
MTERPVESVIIEIPKGSRNKYEYDKEKKVIKYDRMLSSSMVYPSDYGFFPDTLALDGDPLDAMVLTWEPTFPGCVIDVHLVALFDMEDDKGRDEKILCVPKNDPMWNYIETTDQVPPHLFKEITHFFQNYKKLEGKQVTVFGWRGLETAVETLKEAKARYIEQKKQ